MWWAVPTLQLNIYNLLICQPLDRLPFSLNLEMLGFLRLLGATHAVDERKRGVSEVETSARLHPQLKLPEELSLYVSTIG
jgi:hypothetical protein